MTITPVYVTGPRKLVDLRLLSLGDLPSLMSGANNPDIQQYMGSIQGPVSETFERTWLEKVSEPSTQELVLAVVDRSNGELAGSMGLHRIDHVNGTAGTGAFFWNQNSHGKGLGTDAKFALLHWAFNNWPLRKITSSVLSNNPRSKTYQEKTGYQEVGRRKEQYFRNGDYHDEIFMEVFRDRFMKHYNNYVAYL